MHCHLHRGDWSFHLTNEKKKKKMMMMTVITIMMILMMIVITIIVIIIIFIIIIIIKSRANAEMIHNRYTYRISLKTSSLLNQPLRVFERIHANLQQNDCTSSFFLRIL